MEVHARGRLLRLGSFEPDSGHCFTVPVPEISGGDTNEDPHCSRLIVIEDSVVLGPAHALHDAIRDEGGGLYSHWHGTLYLSSSDNTDPRSNGREYRVYAPPIQHSLIQRAAGILESLREDYAPEEAYAAIERCLALLYPKAKLGEDLKSYWDDTAFIAAYRKLVGSNFRALERKYTIHQLMRSLHSLSGDMAECGCYNGATAYFMALASKGGPHERTLHLFDSFEGLSRPGAEDGAYWRAGDLACSEDETKRNLSEFSNVCLYKGWIPARFPEVSDRRFSFVHIDVDIYGPTRNSIEFFFPRLKSGGMLVCDDYGFSSCPGATLAMNEFFATRPERIIHLPTGQGLVIKQL
jgi:Macrocin-O-methyltransferase (TylF)